jgi:hypothetical protein
LTAGAGWDAILVTLIHDVGDEDVQEPKTKTDNITAKSYNRPDHNPAKTINPVPVRSIDEIIDVDWNIYMIRR